MHDKLWQTLSRLPNFNLLKYTDHYVLTQDVGMGSPLVIQGDSLQEIYDKLLAKDYDPRQTFDWSRIIAALSTTPREDHGTNTETTENH